MTDEIEKTKGGRIRKLLLSAFALLGMFYVAHSANQGVTWPLTSGVAIVALSFTSTDVLDKALQSGALGKLKDSLPGGGK
jgi:hypothetical protein